MSHGRRPRHSAKGPPLTMSPPSTNSPTLDEASDPSQSPDKVARGVREKTSVGVTGLEESAETPEKTQFDTEGGALSGADLLHFADGTFELEKIVGGWTRLKKEERVAILDVLTRANDLIGSEPHDA